MNKFLILAIAAYVAVAAAIPIEEQEFTRSILSPTDAEETVELKGDMRLFSDFCKSSRDHVLGSVKDKTNEVASKIFEAIMGAGASVTTEVLEAQKKSVERLGGQIAHPDAPIAEADNEVDAALAEVQQTIAQQQTQPKTFYAALVATTKLSTDIVVQRLSDAYELAKKAAGVSQAIKMLEKGCNSIAEYDETIRQLFEEARVKVAEVNPALGSVPFEAVGCTTARRVVRADSICRLAKSAQDPITKMLQTRKNGL